RVPDGEVADHAEAVALPREIPLQALAPERDLGKPIGVEELGRAEVDVALRPAGIDARRPDADLDTAALGVLLVGRDGRTHFLEAPADGGHHHVLDRELDARVRRIELPDGGRSLGCIRCCHTPGPFSERCLCRRSACLATLRWTRLIT